MNRRRTSGRIAGACLVPLAVCLLAALAPCQGEQGKEPPDAARKEQARKEQARKEAQQREQQRDKLKEQMKQRYPTLEKLRDAELIGETADGEVAVVKDADAARKVDPADPKSGTIGAFVAAENTDRRALYQVLSVDLKTTAAEIGRQNGLRNLRNADPDHWFRLDDGRWVQRKNIKSKREEDGEKKRG